MKLLFLIFILCPINCFSQSDSEYYMQEFYKRVDTSDLDTIQIIHEPYGFFDSLPDIIFRMKNLKKLAMSTATNFYYLSPRIKELKKLKKLIFIKSHIDSIPPEVGELTNLEVLQISWGRGIRFLPAEIGRLKNLEYLDLTRNQLTTLPDQIKYLTKLKRLDLRENNFSVEERQRIKKLLPNCKIIFDY